MAGRSRQTPEQRIWIYCKHEDEAENIIAFCRGSENPRRVPQIVHTSGKLPSWCESLKLTLPTAPPPYSPNCWLEFVQDVDVFLSASIACAGIHRVGERFTPADVPPLFVTDRKKLCAAFANDFLTFLVAQLEGLREEDLLPTVLISDFKTICGDVIAEAPVTVMQSMVLHEVQKSPCYEEPPLETPEASARTRRPNARRSGTTASVPPRRNSRARDELHQSRHSFCGSPTRQVSLVNGIYTQRRGVRSEFGARCFWVLPDGRCAYVAISPDGVRSTQATGPWEVLNGHILIGRTPGSAVVRHSRMGESGLVEQNQCSFESPIFLSLEELISEFEPLMSFADIVARVGEGNADVVRAALRAALTSAQEFSRPRTSRHSSRRPSRRPSKGHALPPSLPPSRPPSAGPCPATHRTHRAPTRQAWDGDHDLQPLPPSDPGEDFDELLSASPSVCAGNAPQQPWCFQTCPLSPGKYRMQIGEPGMDRYRSLSMTLFPDGRYEYREVRFLTVLQAVHRYPSWHIKDNFLVLTYKDKPGAGFLMTEPRGKRKVEKRGSCMQLPIPLVQEMCCFIPFPQQTTPFPGHTPINAEELVCGSIDPSSPILTDPPLDVSSVPLSVFEGALCDRGLKLGHLASGINFLDYDNAGSISLKKLDMLEKHGAPMVDLPMMHELREALLKRFTSIGEAYETMLEGTSNGKVTFDEFVNFLNVITEDKKNKQKTDRLKAWIKKAGPEGLLAAFNGVNPTKAQTINMDDFNTLSLHTAMMTTGSLQTFHDWVVQTYGPSKDSFAEAFGSFNLKGFSALDEKQFVEAAKRVKCPCDSKALRLVFKLLDCNLSGSLTKQEFHNLYGYSTIRLLQNLQELKRFAEKKWGDIDQCFGVLLAKEKSQQVDDPEAEDAISFNVFEKVCTQGGMALTPVELRRVLLFLDEATGSHANGFISMDEWGLLRAFDATAITGSPAKLRRFLEDNFGSPQEAYEDIHEAWMAGLLRKNLDRVAFVNLGLIADQQSSAEEPALPSNGPEVFEAPPLLGTCQKQSLLELPLTARTGQSLCDSASTCSTPRGYDLLAAFADCVTPLPTRLTDWTPRPCPPTPEPGLWLRRRPLPGIPAPAKKKLPFHIAKTRAGTVSAIDWGSG